ncbi:MAG: hypothetical protein IJQ33_11810, partial [Clostridia bacterium]|nr:hypothetical protein [Clostridia bacterium]
EDPQSQAKLISELTVVSLSYLYRFQDSRAPSPGPSSEALFRERLNIISRSALHVNRFFEIFFRIFDLFCFHERFLPPFIRTFVNFRIIVSFALTNIRIIKERAFLFFLFPACFFSSQAK